jgi:hypothetical protein
LIGKIIEIIRIIEKKISANFETMEEPNNESNNGKPYLPSPFFEKNKGRLARLQPEERRAIAQKGGLAKSERKRLSSQLNPIKTGKATSIISISNCDDCQIKEDCPLYRNGSACQVELNIRKSTVRQFKAFIGNNPEDMLKEIMKAYCKLEEMAEEDPSFYKLSQLLYLLLGIYKMKFCEESFITNVNATIDSNSTDIKKIMEKIRKEEGASN